jgi:hypothetical protein
MSAAGRPSGADAARCLMPFVLYSVARDVDAALGVLLHTTLDLPQFVRQALSSLDVTTLARHALAWLAVGGVAWALLAALRARSESLRFRDALAPVADTFAVLYLRPAVTLLALLSLAVQPTYPYAFTLPVALTQDWSVAQDAAMLATLAAANWPRWRWRWRVPAPGALSIAFIAFLVYALITPQPARRWEGHPGNEPKTLRMAVALGHGLTLDVEGVYAGMEALTPRPFLSAVRDAVVGMTRESARMVRAVAARPDHAGAAAIRATRITRQTIRGKEGGVYHVLAPGPSLLLAPALRLDRALNLMRGTPGRLAVTMALWNALAAALVAAVFLLARDAGARAGTAAAVAAVSALLPPLVFYSYQFYPEMLGALSLAIALREILLRDVGGTRRAWMLGLLLAFLPWLHQKFLPVWAVLVLMAVIRAVDALVPLRALIALLAPQLLSAWLFALYNFAITGSVRPDALFLAWGPAGVSSARWGQGLFGLLLDARYGLMPYVPVYLLAFAGVVLPREAGRRRALLWGAAPVVVYYLTVAAADNWSGAVCNLGRYIMPALPYAAALAALVLSIAYARRGVLAVALTLTAWSAVMAGQLWSDPHAANDCALLLARSAIAYGNVYVPNLFIRSWSEGAPGLWARVAIWIVLATILALWVRRAARGLGGAKPVPALFALATILLTAALALERWPSARSAAGFPDAIEIGSGATAFLEDARIDGARAWVDPGEHTVLLRARDGDGRLRVRAEGEGVLRIAGRPPLPISRGGTTVDLALTPVAVLQGRRGVGETLWRQRIEVEAAEAIALTLSAAPPEIR